MPRLRRRKPLPPLGEPELAICMHTFRPGAVAVEIQRGDHLPLDHWAVTSFPAQFMGLVPLVSEEVNQDA